MRDAGAPLQAEDGDPNAHRRLSSPSGPSSSFSHECFHRVRFVAAQLFSSSPILCPRRHAMPIDFHGLAGNLYFIRSVCVLAALPPVLFQSNFAHTHIF